MKKRLLALLLAICTVSSLTACGSTKQEKTAVQEEVKEEEKEEIKEPEKKETKLDVTFEELSTTSQDVSFCTLKTLTEKGKDIRYKFDISLSSLGFDKNSENTFKLDNVEEGGNGQKCGYYALYSDESRYKFDTDFHVSKLREGAKELSDTYIEDKKAEIVKDLTKRYDVNPDNVDTSCAKEIMKNGFKQTLLVNGNFVTVKYDAGNDQYKITQEIILKDMMLKVNMEYTNIPGEFYDELLEIIRNYTITNASVFDDGTDGIKLLSDGNHVLTCRYNETSEKSHITAIHYGQETSVIENANEYPMKVAISIPNDDPFNWISPSKFEIMSTLDEGTELTTINGYKAYINNTYRRTVELLIPTGHVYGDLSSDRTYICVTAYVPLGELTKKDYENLIDFASKWTFEYE